MVKQLNLEAWELRRELFKLAVKFKDLAFAGSNTAAGPDLEQVAIRLVNVHAELPDIFIDAARDKKDQSYAVLVDL